MRISIGSKLIGGFVFVSLLVGLAGIFGIYNIGVVGKAADVILNEKVPVADMSMEGTIDIVSARDALGEFLLSKNETELKTIESEFYKFNTQFDKHVDAIVNGDITRGVIAVDSDSEIAKSIYRIQKLQEKFQSNATELMEHHKALIELETQANELMEIFDDNAQSLDQLLAAYEEALTKDIGNAINKKMDASMEAKSLMFKMKAIAEEYVALENASKGELRNEFIQTSKAFDVLKPYLTKEVIQQYEEFKTLAIGRGKMFDLKDEAVLNEEETYEHMKIVDNTGKDVDHAMAFVEEIAGKDMQLAMVKADKAKKTSRSALITVTIAALLIGVFIGVFITKGITKPLAKCVDFAQQIARGDLSKKVEINMRDETGDLGDALNGMLVSLRSAMDDVNQKVDYLNKVPTPVVVIDRNYEVIFMNEAGAKTIGRTVETCIGQKCYNLFDTPHCNTPACRCCQAMEKGGIFTGETIARGAGNIPIQYTAAPLKDKEGNIVGALKYVTDFTQVRKAMDDAQEKIDYLNNVPTPVVVVDKEYKITFINEAGAKALGKTVEACLGQKCFNLFDTPHCNTPACRCCQAMEKGGIFTGETIARGAGNIPIQYTAAPLKDKEGNIVGALEYVTDFTQVRKAMDDAQEKVDYLNNVPTPVVVIDKEYKITFMNEAGAKTIGKTVEACIGQKCYNLFETPHCNTPECRCRQAMEKDGVFMGETIARGAGNIFIQYTAAPMKDKAGKILGALEYVTNISAIKEKQAYLEENAKVISDIMARFANGDLTVNIEKEKEDEIGLIIDNINLAVSKIREIVMQIRDAAGNVACTGEEISAATDQITKGAQNQASAADETGSTMEEMSVQIQNVAKNAEGLASNVDETTSSIQQMGTTAEGVAKMAETMASNVSETSSSIEQMIITLEKTANNVNEADNLSSQASTEATGGADAVMKMVQGMRVIGDMMKNISVVIQNLGKRSEAIGSIVKVIEEIADQTNLLALNAAIEAARAGEAGQGFAVVADEVRKLAERSVKATKEIGDVIKEVQAETSSAVKATEDGAKSSQEGIVLADQAGSAISKITEAVQATSNIMKEISGATSEQSTAARNVVAAIDEMNKLTQSVTQSTNEQAAGIKQVVKAAEAMSQLTEQVKNATLEQKKGGENVVKAVENISEIAKGNLSAVEQLSRSAKDMAQQSEGLQELVQAFKTD